VADAVDETGAVAAAARRPQGPEDSAGGVVGGDAAAAGAPEWAPPALKDVWQSLAEPARAALAERQAAAEKLTSEHKALHAGLGEVAEALSPVRDLIAAGQVRPAQYISNLVTWERALATDPARAIAALARQVGVDLASVAAGEPAAATPSREQDIATRLAAEVTAIKRKLAATEEASTAETIAAFANGKPHFEQVRTIMGALLTSGQADSLQDAYDKAIWASPEVRAQVLAEQQAAEQKRREAAAVAAKKAAAVNVRAGGPPSPGAGMSFEEQIRAAVNEAYAGH
jgi:hypothetical protein